MAARKLGQYVPDWVQIFTRVAPDVKSNMLKLRVSYETLAKSLNSVSAKPEAINWDFYAKNAANPALIASFQKAFEATNVPYPKDTGSAEIAEMEEEMEQNAEELRQESVVRVKETEAELAKVLAMKPFEEMTVEEYVEMYPEIGEQAEKEMAEHKWT